jgi:hypothetical protein
MRIYGFVQDGNIALVTYSQEGGAKLYRAYNKALPNGVLTPETLVSALHDLKPYEGNVGPEARFALQGAFEHLIRKLEQGAVP